MPLLLSYPRRLPAGRVFGDIVTNVDWAQTILDAAGVEHHPRMQGRSFWPDLLGSPDAPAAEGMYYRYWEHDDAFHTAPAHYGYRTQRYKFIYFYNDGMGIRAAATTTTRRSGSSTTSRAIPRSCATSTTTRSTRRSTRSSRPPCDVSRPGSATRRIRRSRSRPAWRTCSRRRPRRCPPEGGSRWG